MKKREEINCAKNKIFYKIDRYVQTADNCGPYALAQLISFFGKKVDPKQIEKQTKEIKEIGTWEANLGITSLNLGFKARITPMNNYSFDPSWEKESKKNLIEELKARREKISNSLLKKNLAFFIEFLLSGGKIEFKPISKGLLVDKLKHNPIIVGLSSNYLYKRKLNANKRLAYRFCHFVTVNGYDLKNDKFFVTDSNKFNPFSQNGRYKIGTDTLVAAIYLAEATFDSTILEIYK